MSRFLLQTILRSVRKESELKSQAKGMWGVIAITGRGANAKVGSFCKGHECPHQGGVKSQRWGQIAKTALKTQRCSQNAKGFWRNQRYGQGQ